MPKSGVTAFLIKELKEVLPPTVFFVVGFNLIVLTTDLILADYLRSFASFLVATMTALVVGKSVLVANAIPLARRFDNRPLIQPVLFKTIFYWVVVFLVRFLEKLVEYLLAGGTFSGVPEYISKHFSWHRFAAIQIWIFVLFLIYNSMVELNAVLGKGELEKLFFTRRSPKTLRNSKSPQQGQRAESREQRADFLENGSSETYALSAISYWCCFASKTHRRAAMRIVFCAKLSPVSFYDRPADS